MNYINLDMTLFDVVNEYPEVKDYLIGQGMYQVEDSAKLNTLGKALSLKMVIASKNINQDLFISQMEEIISDTRNRVDTSLLEKAKIEDAGIDIQGILPCPVRIPLLEGFENWLDDQTKELKDNLNYELKAASMGVDWLKDSLVSGKGEEELADVFLSAGFDLFFDKKLMGHLKDEKVFEDLVAYENYNKDFDNDYISLRDPDGDYSVIGVVPAVFLVNQNALNGRKIPYTWKELLSGEFENSVSLPVGDFDLFNAILLNLHKQYGMEGIKILGKTLMKSMHPSEMVKSDKKPEQPAVTIMPYFFTKMTRAGGPMVAVWPQDGAIISPIFMLTKRSKKAQLQPIVDFYASKEVGEILSHNGKFPSVHPEVDNYIPADQKYMWIGWDYIKDNDIAALIDQCMTTFNGGTQ